MSMAGDESRVTRFSSVMHSVDKEDEISCGGEVKTFTAAAALNIGDIVFFTSAGKVNKSTTAADYVAFVGVVVAGESTDMTADFAPEAVGQQAASGDGKKVLVALPNSIVYVVAGVGGATRGGRMIPSGATAGAAIAGTTATQVVGIALQTVTATNKFKLFIKPM